MELLQRQTSSSTRLPVASQTCTRNSRASTAVMPGEDSAMRATPAEHERKTVCPEGVKGRARGHGSGIVPDLPDADRLCRLLCRCEPLPFASISLIAWYQSFEST